MSEPTEERGVREIARRMLVLALFGAWLFIRTKSGDLIHFGRAHWHAEQAAFEEARTGLDLVLKGRQIGFTTIELARDVQFACTRHGTNTVIVAHTLGAKKALFRVVRHMVDGLVRLGIVPEPSFNTVDEIVIPWTRRTTDVLTGRVQRVEVPSTIKVIEAGATETSADDKGRSGTIHRAHFTEFAFYREAKATMKAIRGAMPKDGSAQVVIESTPNGAAGEFFTMVSDIVKGKPSSYRLHFFAWYRHAEYRRPLPAEFDPTPRDEWEQKLRAVGCDDEQIQFWRERVDAPDEGGLEGALQEYPIDALSCFRMSSGAYVETDVVDFVTRNVVTPLRSERVLVRFQPDNGSGDAERWPTRDLGEVQIFGEHVGGREVIVTGDVAEGGGGDADYLVARARDRRTFELLASFRSNTIGPGDFGIVMAWMGHRYGRALVAPERNKDGGTTIDRMLTQRTSVTPYPRIYEAPDKKLGWSTDKLTRPPMWDGLRSFLRTAAREGLTGRLFDVHLADEVRTLVLLGGKPQAQTGAHDDVFTSDAIALELRQRSTAPRGAEPPRVGAGEASGFSF